MGIQAFMLSEDGAVTVDWVVLTAAFAGLGIATGAVVSGGVEDASGEIASYLADVEIVTEFDTAFEALELATMDFANGVGEWVGGSARNMGGSLGDMLVLGPGESTQLTFDVPSGAARATMTFNLIGGDSIDRETATVLVNGQAVTIATGNHGAVSFVNSDIPGITVETEILTEREQLGGSMRDNWRESVSTVTITVDDPGNSVTLGVASTTNQSINDEYFAIDDVVIGAS